MKKIQLTLLSLGLLFILTAGLIAMDGLSDNAQTSDAAIVLGSKVTPDGVPSARLQARLDRAVELYRQGRVRNIIVSGGTG
ncbi:YdcF family protein, partial [Pseudomonas syringae pv. tomato]